MYVWHATFKFGSFAARSTLLPPRLVPIPSHVTAAVVYRRPFGVRQPADDRTVPQLD